MPEIHKSHDEHACTDQTSAEFGWPTPQDCSSCDKHAEGAKGVGKPGLAFFCGRAVKEHDQPHQSGCYRKKDSDSQTHATPSAPLMICSQLGEHGFSTLIQLLATPRSLY
jgi:hypothetical protein